LIKVQWVDIKLENVLVSLHFLKTMGLVDTQHFLNLYIYYQCF